MPPDQHQVLLFRLIDLYGMQIDWINKRKEDRMENHITAKTERILFYVVTLLLFLTVMFV